MERIISLGIGYLFGMIQTGFLYGKTQKIDIREHGSGNAGTTNTLRTLGWKAGVITFLGDMLKMILACLIVMFIYDYEPLCFTYVMYTGMGVVLGHNYPFYLKFKGGKGIAASFGLMLILDPIIALTVLVVFLAIFLTTKYVSLGSLVIMIVFAVEFIIFGQIGRYGFTQTELYEMYVIVVFLAALSWWRHRANIKRLIAGNENKIDFSKIKK